MNAEERIAELEAELKGLKDNLIHDQMTGLKTRSFFEQDLETYLLSFNYTEEKKRKEHFGYKNISLIFFDIDHFKKVNDKYGHDVGDTTLQKVAKTINSCFRAGDTVARWGGEEFIASLLGANTENAALKAEEVRVAVEQLTFPERPKLRVTVSAGVSTCKAGISLQETIRQADQAMYQAKRSGRNQVKTYGDQE